MNLVSKLVAMFLFFLPLLTNAYPAWVLNHSPDQASGCSEVKKGNVLQAKRVALIKARRTLIESRSITISAESSLKQDGKHQEFSQVVKTTSKGNAGIANLPIEQGHYEVGNKEYWCVLIK